MRGRGYCSGPSDHDILRRPLPKFTISVFSIQWKGKKPHSFITMSPQMSSKWSATWLLMLIYAASLALFALTIVGAQASFASQTRSDQKQPLQGIDKIDVSLALTILRLFQALLSTSSTFLLQECCQLLQWSLISTTRGMSYGSVLSISPTTGSLGMMTTIISSTSNASCKVWAILR